MIAWIGWIVFGVLIAAFFVLRKGGSIEKEKARALFDAGARLIDVRSQGEYERDGLKAAVNVPLDVLVSRIATVAPDKEAPLLCHCASGLRSANAVSQLRRLGYTQAYNVGSLPQARSIAEPAS